MENLNEMKMDMKELEQVNGGKDNGICTSKPDYPTPVPQPVGHPMPRPWPDGIVVPSRP